MCFFHEDRFGSNKLEYLYSYQAFKSRYMNITYHSVNIIFHTYHLIWTEISSDMVDIFPDMSTDKDRYVDDNSSLSESSANKIMYLQLSRIIKSHNVL